jgi:branched-subunit amino acid aminotransferase/4-amino-4-deoxychorismate lyase
MPTIFLNGQFVEPALVSALDAGIQHAVGLFETLLANNGRTLFVERHCERLVHSAKELGLSGRLRAAALADAVQATVRESGLERARVRLTITGGDLNLLGAGKAVEPTVLIVAQPATEYPREMFERGVTTTIADFRTNPLDPMAGHKTLNYWGRLRELQGAAAKKAGEALVFQVTNHLAGGCVSNAFIVKDGRLLTPIARGEEVTKEGAVAVPSPVLPGITRRFVLEWAAEQGIVTERRMLGISDVLGADEVFLTNSSWGVLPVTRVEREAIGDGLVGPVTERTMRAWEEETASEV